MISRLKSFFSGEKKTTDMTVGDPGRLILGFFFPLLAGNLFQQMYSLVDSIVVGRGINGDALAAVGATGSVSFFLIGFASGLTTGFGVNIAIEFGAANYEKLKKTVGMSVFLCLLISVTFTVLSEVTVRPLLTVLNTDAEIFDDALRYIRIIFGGILITMTYNICASMLRSLGDSRTPFLAVIIGSLTNVTLDLLFVLVFRLGVAGAAIATVISQLVACVFCLKRLNRIELIHINRSHLAPDGRLCFKLLKTGIPVALMSSITAIGCLIVQYFVNSFGKLTISAFAAISKIINLSMQPSGTLGAAVSTFVGQNYGARKFDRIRAGVKKASLYGVLISILIGSLMILIPKQLISIMVSEPEIIELTPTYLRMCGVFTFVVAELFVVRNACIGLGRTFISMISGALELGLRVLVLFTLTESLGFTAVPVAECAAWTGAMLLIMGDFLYGMRKLSRKSAGTA